MNKLICLALCGLMSVSCSTASKTRNMYSIGGFAVGAAVGGATAPKDEKAGGHAVLWGGVIGLIASFIANYFINEDKKIAAQDKELKELKSRTEFVSTGEKTGIFTNAFDGTKYKETWRTLKGSEWVQDGPDSKYHIDLKAKKVKSVKIK